MYICDRKGRSTKRPTTRTSYHVATSPNIPGIYLIYCSRLSMYITLFLFLFVLSLFCFFFIWLSFDLRNQYHVCLKVCTAHQRKLTQSRTIMYRRVRGCMHIIMLRSYMKNLYARLTSLLRIFSSLQRLVYIVCDTEHTRKYWQYYMHCSYSHHFAE